MIMNLNSFIAYCDQHISLNKEEIELLKSKLRYRRYRKGQYVLQQGDICKTSNFVISGCLRIFHLDDDGREHTLMFPHENWWASDLGSFLSQTEAEYYIQCLEPVELLQFSVDMLDELYKEIPKLERLFRIVSQNAIVTLGKRIVRNYSLPAKEKYLAFRTDYPQIEQRVPQYMIASYIGVTKEFLSKIRSEL